MHPTQKCIRRHQHDLTSAQIRTAADLASHHSQDIPEQQSVLKTLLHSELLAQIVLFSSTCQVVLHVLSPILFHHFGCRSLCSCTAVFLSSPYATACRSDICSPFPRSIDTHSATRAVCLFFTRSVSVSLSLYACILALPVQLLSQIVLIHSRDSLL